MGNNVSIMKMCIYGKKTCICLWKKIAQLFDMILSGIDIDSKKTQFWGYKTYTGMMSMHLNQYSRMKRRQCFMNFISNEGSFAITKNKKAVRFFFIQTLFIDHFTHKPKISFSLHVLFFSFYQRVIKMRN